MKDVKRTQLRRVIMAILIRNPNLYYYQGFHDFVSVFLLTLDENLAFYCANTASNYLISDFMLEGFEQGIFPMQDMISGLTEVLDPELAEMIQAGGGRPHFCISWLLTWFAHDIDCFSKVQLIYDACLATHPCFVSYIIVAQMIISKNALLGRDTDGFDDDVTAFAPEDIAYMVFRSIKDNQMFSVDEAIR